MKASKKKYELVVVLNPKTEEKDKIFKKISTFLKGHDFSMENKNHIGLKDLVYKIDNCDKGDFWGLELNGEKGLKLNELNVLLNREKNIIRYLILKKE